MILELYELEKHLINCSLKCYRKRNNYSQEGFVPSAVVERSYYSRIENDRIIASDDIYFDILDFLSLDYKNHFDFSISTTYDIAYDKIINLEYSDAFNIIKSIDFPNNFIIQELSIINDIIISSIRNENKYSEDIIKTYLPLAKYISDKLYYLLVNALFFKKIHASKLIEIENNSTLYYIEDDPLSINRLFIFRMTKEFSKMQEYAETAIKSFERINNYSRSFNIMCSLIMHEANNSAEGFMEMVIKSEKYLNEHFDDISEEARILYTQQVSIVLYSKGEYYGVILRLSKIPFDKLEIRAQVLLNSSYSMLNNYTSLTKISESSNPKFIFLADYYDALISNNNELAYIVISRFMQKTSSFNQFNLIDKVIINEIKKYANTSSNVSLLNKLNRRTNK